MASRLLGLRRTVCGVITVKQLARRNLAAATRGLEIVQRVGSLLVVAVLRVWACLPKRSTCCCMRYIAFSQRPARVPGIAKSTPPELSCKMRS